MSQVEAKLMSSRGPSLRLVVQLNLEWILIVWRRIPMSISSTKWSLSGEIVAVLNSLGANAAKYRRERSMSTRAVVSETYSPPRVTAATKLILERRIIPGFALDLTTADTYGQL